MTPTADRFLRFNCPRCLALLRTAQAAAGTRRRCPRCHLVLEVPRQSQTAPSGDVYPLSQEASPSPAGQPAQVLVVCAVCHTRMYATEDQVGQKISCPDCGAAAVVPPPVVAPPKPAAATTTTEVYPLCDEAPPAPGRGRADDESLIRIVCPRCHTMMYAAEDQVGGKLVCPDCGMSSVVPPPPPRRREIDVMAGAGAGYRLAEPYQTHAPETAPPLPPPPPSPPPLSDAPRLPARTESRFDSCGQRPVLPPRPFLTGTFTFPFSRGALPRVVVLAVWAMLIIGVTGGSILLGTVSRDNAWAGPYWLVGAMLGAATLILTLMWFSFASACSLAVVRDTASGCDEIQNWPDMAFIDWILEPLYIFVALCAGTLPGAGLARLLAMYGRPNEGVALLSLFFLFPFVLLSTLETGSPLGVLSWPVCRTVWMAWEAWMAFYLASAVLLAAAGGLTIAALSAGMFWGTIVTALVEITAWLIYFRLLGRLAWYCTERTRRQAEPDDDESSDQDGDA